MINIFRDREIVETTVIEIIDIEDTLTEIKLLENSL